MALDIGQPVYPVVDLRGTALSDAVGSRGINPVGTCVHHTGGVNSLSTLTGHHGAGEEPVSADVLITKSGQRYLITRDNQWAFGVGKVNDTIQARYEGVNLNEILLSAELEYLPLEGPTYEQYDSLAEQITIWALRWGWRFPYVIFGHYGIASPPGRKYDPYMLDWGELMGRLVVWTRANKVAGLD